MEQVVVISVSAVSPDDIMGHFAADEEVIVFGPYLPGVHRGHDEARAHYADLWDGVREVKSDVTDYHAPTDGAVATLLTRQNLTLVMVDGSEKHLSVRHSDCLRRNGDGWEALMEMISFPVDLKTGFAIMDLREQANA